MHKDKKASIVPLEGVVSRIFLVRGQKVMLDADLAELYGVEVKRLNEQVKRNIERFPQEFSFQLTVEENNALRSQIATLESESHLRFQIGTSSLKSQFVTSSLGQA